MAEDDKKFFRSGVFKVLEYYNKFYENGCIEDDSYLNSRDTLCGIGERMIQIESLPKTLFDRLVNEIVERLDSLYKKKRVIHKGIVMDQ